MFKFLIFCVLFSSTYSESIKWFEGRWLPTILYSNTFTNKTEEWVGWRKNGAMGLWSGWLVDPMPECGWLEVSTNLQNCTCGNRTDVPLVQLQDFGHLDQHQFYQFRLNESRPVIVVDRVKDVKEALSAKCQCGNKESTQLVFRKTRSNYLMVYENKGQTETSPNMTLVMFRSVPNLRELQGITSHYPSYHLDMPFQQPTLICQPKFFDASAYVVDSSENNSPFINLNDLKGSKSVKSSSKPNSGVISLTESSNIEVMTDSSERAQPMLYISLLQLIAFLYIQN